MFATMSAACGIPRDPDKSLERIAQSGVLRGGITARPPWTTDQGGPEAEAVEAFARAHGARVEWRRGSESELFEALEERELDIVVGGITGDTPWGPRLGLTRPYAEADDKQHVVAVAPGENRLLFAFDRMLRAQAPAIAARTGSKPLS